MASGLPVVVTDCGGTREAVTDGVEGFVIPRREPDAMARALLTLWRDADLRRRMGAAGRARAEAEFDMDRQVDRFDELYRSLALQTPASSAPGRARQRCSRSPA